MKLAEGDSVCLVINGNGIDAGRTPCPGTRNSFFFGLFSPTPGEIEEAWIPMIRRIATRHPSFLSDERMYLHSIEGIAWHFDG